MKTSVQAGLIALAAILLIPSAPDRRSDVTPPLALWITKEAHGPARSAESQAMVRVLEDGAVSELDEADYLTRVILSEMLPGFGLEAMKAQAVAARTFALRQRAAGKHPEADVCTQSSCCQACCSVEDLRERLGDQFRDAWALAYSAVQQTEGEVLTFGGKLIDATYFSCSGGSTEDAAAVWGTDVPYLRAVESPGEQDAAVFASSVCVSAEAFRQTICTVDSAADFSAGPADWIGQAEQTPGGGVAWIRIGGTEMTGVQLRRLFHLNSTKFTLAWDGTQFVFDVRGYGHRVGMSQYGAQAMAELGFDYRAILLYYYRGVTIIRADE